jgi:hypothetical protein
MIAALLRKAAPRPVSVSGAAGPATGSSAMEKKLRSELYKMTAHRSGIIEATRRKL